MITEQSIISLSKKLEVAELSGEKAMIDFATGKYYLIKGSANDIWEYIQNDISVQELVDALLEIYDIDKKTCLQSTIAFLEQMDLNGFLIIT